MLSAARDALDAAIAAAAELDAIVEEARRVVDEARAALDDALDTARDTLAAVPDPAALHDALVDALTGAPLFDLGAARIGVSASADAARGGAGIDCAVSGVTLLGQAVDVPSCAALDGALGEINATVSDVLSGLPAGAPSVTIAGLRTSTETSGAPDAQRRTRALARVTGLRVGIGALELRDAVDPLIGDVADAVDELLAAPPLDTTDAGAGDVAAAGLTEELDAALSALDEQLSALPTGAALDGLRTPAIDVALGGVASRAAFQAAASDDGNVPPPGTVPPPPTDPGAGDPPAGDPGTGDPGTGDPGTGDPGVDPGAPLQDPGHSAAPPQVALVPPAPPPAFGAPPVAAPPAAPPVAPPPPLPAAPPGPLAHTGSDSLSTAAAALLVLLTGAHVLAATRRPQTAGQGRMR